MPPTRLRTAIREARSTDAGSLIALQRAIYEEGRWFVGDGPPTTEAMRRRLQLLDSHLSLMLVAAEGERLCGWLELHRPHARRMRHVATLTLAVAASHRRQGIGRALLRRGFRWSRRCGVEKVSLNVRASNGGAIELYRREGFELEGRERSHIRTDGGFEDNLIMARFLGGDDG